MSCSKLGLFILKCCAWISSDLVSHLLSQRALRAVWDTLVGPWWCSRCSSSPLLYQCLLSTSIPSSPINKNNHRQKEEELSITESDTPNVVPVNRNSATITVLRKKTAADPEVSSCPGLQSITGFSHNRKRRRMTQNYNKDRREKPKTV